MKLRIVQLFTNGGKSDLLPPICDDAKGCEGRSVALYADENRKGVALCGRHARERKEDGTITTCGERMNSCASCCTQDNGHSGDHQYSVDGRVCMTAAAGSY